MARLSCLFVALLMCRGEVDEAGDEICMNGCTEHGTCFDFVCTCDLGWHGDDCRHPIVSRTVGLVPILSAGHFNLTARNFTAAVAKLPLVFVGYSARSCLKCVGAEGEYGDAEAELRRLKVPFARADVDDPGVRALMSLDWGTTLPLVVVHRRGSAPRVYEGAHSSEAIVAYAAKLKAREPYTALSSVAQVGQFFGLASEDARLFKAREALEGQEEDGISLKTNKKRTVVVGFFEDHDGVENEEWREFVEVAETMRHRPDVYFGAVTRPGLAQAFVDSEVWLDRTPSLVLRRDDASFIHSPPMEEVDGGLRLWIDRESIDEVGELTPANFARYETLLLPMFLLFLDLRGHDRTMIPGGFVGGKSGGVFNEDIVAELHELRRDGSFAQRVAFAYVDGHAYADRMKALGIFGGPAALPALAFNTNEPGVVAVYPHDLPLHRDSLRKFVAGFLSNSLRTPQDTKRFALQHVSNTRAQPQLLPKRKKRKGPPAERVGVSEQFGVGSLGVTARGFADHVLHLTTANFSKIALDESKDVLVLFHALECANCAGMAVYYKKLAERFDDLNFSSLVVARFDASDDIPPLEGNPLNAAELPTLLMLPANEKRPPFTFYSGISKVQPMMNWVEQFASIKFKLPELSHLTPEDRILYKEQVTDNERYRKEGEL